MNDSHLVHQVTYPNERRRDRGSPEKLATAREAVVQLDFDLNDSLLAGCGTVNFNFKPKNFHPYSLCRTVSRDYRMMLIARAMIMPPMTKEVMDCTIIIILHQRDSGRTSAGANDAALVKARYR